MFHVEPHYRACPSELQAEPVKNPFLFERVVIIPEGDLGINVDKGEGA